MKADGEFVRMYRAENMGVSYGKFPRHLGLVVCMAAALVLSACGGTSPARHGTYTGGTYKVGTPYQVAGQWYYPAEDWGYNQTGLASWYGADFDGNPTANGEVYDMDLFTAAHKTLPMPIHARVTNLENGESIVVRINDRGPFVQGRIIDLSRAAAQELGFLNQGTARVRVQSLGRAPLNTSTAEARDVMEGRTTRVASAAPSSSVTAAAIAPPGSTGGRVTATRHRNVNGASSAPRNRAVAEPTDIYVQAGSFRQEQNAQRVLNSLAAGGSGRDARIMPTWVDGQRFFRVRMGPFNQVSDADAALARVVSLGHHGARIVVD